MPARLIARAATGWQRLSTACAALGPTDVLGGHVQGVEVALDGFAEPDGGVLLVSQQGAGRSWGVVSGQDLFNQLGRGGGQYRVGPDEGVRVPVADH